MNQFKLTTLIIILLLSQSAYGFGFGPGDPVKAFAKIDTDANGILSKQEFKENGPNPPFKSNEKIFKKIDTNKDDQITKKEFFDGWGKRGK